MKRFLVFLAAFSFVRLAIAGSLTLLGAGGGGVVGTCPASQAFFARAAANIAAAPTNLTPSITTWESAVDGLICGQATAGTWTLKDAEYFLPAPSTALAEMNLVSSSFTLTPHGSVTMDPNVGWTGDGSTAYADTGYMPTSGQMTTGSLSFGICLLNNRTPPIGSTPSFSSAIGTQSASSQYLIDALTDGAGTSTFVAAGAVSVAISAANIPTTLGSFVESRTSTANYLSYYDASLKATTTATATISGVGDFLLLGSTQNSGSPGAFSIDTIGLAFIGGGLTGAQITADRALFQAAMATMLIQAGC